jgi:hypothetical protein
MAYFIQIKPCILLYHKPQDCKQFSEQTKRAERLSPALIKNNLDLIYVQLTKLD